MLYFSFYLDCEYGDLFQSCSIDMCDVPDLKGTCCYTCFYVDMSTSEVVSTNMDDIIETFTTTYYLATSSEKAEFILGNFNLILTMFD